MNKILMLLSLLLMNLKSTAQIFDDYLQLQIDEHVNKVYVDSNSLNNYELTLLNTSDFDTFNKDNRNCYKSFIYKNIYGDHAIILPRLLIETRKDISSEALLEKIENIHFIENIGNIYVFKSDCNLSEEILEQCKTINSLEEVIWCEPDMIISDESNNPLFYKQHYLKNTGQNNGIAGVDINIEPAWLISNGNSNIKVAIVDEGVDDDHIDMLNTVISGYTSDNELGDGKPINPNEKCDKSHGIACAGIIAANNNDIGIRGIASGVKILPVNICPFLGDDDNPNGTCSTSEYAKAIK